MINVVGAEGRAGEALEQVVFLVCGAVRTDEADGLATVGSVKLFELCGRGLRGFFPGDREKLVCFPQQRLLETLRVPGEIETETALHTEEFLVDAGQVAVVSA